jgi:putative phosphoesterase
MSIKIGLISDVHATPSPLRDALTIFRENNVEMVLCAGDMAGYGTELAATVDLLIESECELILGNHDIWLLDSLVSEEKKRLITFFSKLPLAREFMLQGKSLYLVHGSPVRPLSGGIRLLDEKGDLLRHQQAQWRRYLADFPSDVLIVGHTHQVFAEQLGRTLVINPGSTKFNHTCAILRLPELALEIRPLANQTPVLSWHWRLNREKSR